MKAFFSRRIGIDQGQEVPLDWGGRLTGRVGKWNVGVLGVSTDQVDEEGRRLVPDELFGVFRLKRNLGERSSLGMIVTERDPSGAGFNRLYGLDLDYKPTTTSSFYLFGAGSENEDGSDESGSFGTGGGLYAQQYASEPRHRPGAEELRPCDGLSAAPRLPSTTSRRCDSSHE